MNKIYGYKEQDVLGLAEFLRERKTRSLAQVFELYSIKSGKAKGTVRNLYYALAKLSRTDAEFCQKYLDGKPLCVSKIQNFSDKEERLLVKTILLGQRDGRSARGVIMELAKGDGKIALRYQNKFRNAVKNKPKMIAEIVSELKIKDKSMPENVVQSEIPAFISEAQFSRIKNEINGLVGRIALKTKRENQRLKERVEILERENLRLSTLLYSDGKKPKTIGFFGLNKGEGMIN